MTSTTTLTLSGTQAQRDWHGAFWATTEDAVESLLRSRGLKQWPPILEAAYGIVKETAVPEWANGDADAALLRRDTLRLDPESLARETVELADHAIAREAIRRMDRAYGN